MTWLIEGRSGRSIADYQIPEMERFFQEFELYQGKLNMLFKAMVPERQLHKPLFMQLLMRIEEDPELQDRFDRIRELGQKTDLLFQEDNIMAMANTEGGDQFKAVKKNLETLHAGKWAAKIKKDSKDSGADQFTHYENELDD